MYLIDPWMVDENEDSLSVNILDEGVFNLDTHKMADEKEKFLIMFILTQTTDTMV